MIAPVFRFDAVDHAYYLNDQRIPSITQLIDMAGLVDGADFFTERSRERGTTVHTLCTEYDLGVLTRETLESEHQGYVLAYIAACETVKPSWLAIEEADVHPELRFAGRIDRVGTMLGAPAVVELKTAAKARHHAIQTALQAILASRRYGWMPSQIGRFVFYLKDSGKFTVEPHTRAADLHDAETLIRRFCR